MQAATTRSPLRPGNSSNLLAGVAGRLSPDERAQHGALLGQLHKLERDLVRLRQMRSRYVRDDGLGAAEAAQARRVAAAREVLSTVEGEFNEKYEKR